MGEGASARDQHPASYAGAALCLVLASGPAAADGEPQRFNVWEFRVRGSTVLDRQAVERAVYPFLGPGRSIDDVEHARQAVEKLYQEARYDAALVDIPEQDVQGGVVVLAVTEGKIERVKISGSRYFSLGRIREKLPALADGKPLNLQQTQTQLAELAEQSGDRRITPVIRAGQTPGAVEVELKVDDRLPLHGSVELTTRNSVNTGLLRLSAMLRYDNLWQRFHSASLQYQLAPEHTDNVEVWAGTYVMPVEAWDSRLAFYGVGLNSSSKVPVATVGDLTVIGNGEIFGLRLIHPLPAEPGWQHSLTLGWDYKHFGQSVLLGGTAAQSSPITYLPFLAGYDGVRAWSDGSTSEFGVELNLAVRDLFGSQDQFAAKRYGARADYFYAAGKLEHTQVLPGDFRGVIRLSGQITDSPLVSNEQLSAGGMQTVRGYHQSERLGDDGGLASVELLGPDLAERSGWGEGGLRPLLFSDAAYLRLHQALPGNPGRYQLWSMGAGLKLGLHQKLHGEFYWAYPFSPTEIVRVGEQRVDFRVAYEY